MRRVREVRTMAVACSSSTRSSSVNAPIDSFVYALTPQSVHIFVGEPQRLHASCCAT